LTNPLHTGSWRFIALRAVCALSIATGGFVCEAAASASSHGVRETGFSFALHGSPGVGDFDGDNRADIVYAEPQGRVNGTYRYHVEVRLSTQSGANFDIDSGAAGGLHISTRDVDGDHDLDLVITSAFGGQQIGVWINDGHGQFTQGTAESYPLSIWQEPDRLWETPERPHFPPAAFVVPAGNSTIETGRFEIPSLANTEQSLHAVRETYRHKALNSGSPLRAPPLS
jgi:hypothetical protein